MRSGEIDLVEAVIGVFIAGPILTSLVQDVFSLDLYAVFECVVALYRSLITPVIAWIQSPLVALLDALNVDWTIPQWFRDLHALSFALGGIEARALAWASRKTGAVKDATMAMFLRKSWEAFWLGLTGWSFWRIGRLAFAARAFRSVAKMPHAERSPQFQFFYLTYLSKLQSIALAVATSAVFYLFNAFANSAS